MMEIYTDGACNPNPGVGGWGVVVYQNHTEAWTDCGGAMRTTNNRMEMKAIIEAMKLAHGKPCNIYSDSKLCVLTLTTWAKGWKFRGWKKSTPGEIKNLDLVQEAYEMYLQAQARIIWVKGHAGIKGNERADRLANEGCTKVINSQIMEVA